MGGDMTGPDNAWPEHYCSVDRYEYASDEAPESPESQRDKVEPWLTALF